MQARCGLGVSSFGPGMMTTHIFDLHFDIIYRLRLDYLNGNNGYGRTNGSEDNLDQP